MFNRNFKIKVNSLFDWMELDMVRYVLLCVLGELLFFQFHVHDDLRYGAISINEEAEQRDHNFLQECAANWI